MQLPPFLPPDLLFLTSLSDETALFHQISSSPPLMLRFLEIASDDPGWCESYAPLLSKLLRRLTDLFYSDLLDLKSAQETATLIHAKSRILSPLIPHDITLDIRGEKLPCNSLMLAASSEYFNRLVRQMGERHEKHLKISKGDPEPIGRLLDLIHKGGEELLLKSKEELESSLHLAKIWQLNPLSLQLEERLASFITPESALSSLIDAKKLEWFRVAKGAAEIYNRLERGMQLSIGPEGELTVKFRDLKTLSTLVEYQTIASWVSIGHFTGVLPSDESFKSVLQATPALFGLDFSDSTAAPDPLEAIPDTLKWLNLSRADWLTDSALKALLERCPKVETVILEKQGSLGLSSWVALSRLPELKELDLTDVTQLKDSDLLLLSTHPGKLEKLSLAGAKSLSPTALKEMIMAAGELTHLNLAKTEVNDENLAEIAVSLNHLKVLDLSMAKNVTPKGVAKLQKNPSLKVITT